MLSERILCAENQIKDLSMCPRPLPNPPGFSSCSVEISVINSLSLEHSSSPRGACRRTMLSTQHCLILSQDIRTWSSQRRKLSSLGGRVLTYWSCSDPWRCMDRSQMGGIYEQTAHPKRPGQLANYRVRKYNNHFTETGQRQLQNPSSVIPSFLYILYLCLAALGPSASPR